MTTCLLRFCGLGIAGTGCISYGLGRYNGEKTSYGSNQIRDFWKQFQKGLNPLKPTQKLRKQLEITILENSFIIPIRDITYWSIFSICGGLFLRSKLDINYFERIINNNHWKRGFPKKGKRPSYQYTKGRMIRKLNRTETRVVELKDCLRVIFLCKQRALLHSGPLHFGFNFYVLYQFSQLCEKSHFPDSNFWLALISGAVISTAVGMLALPGAGIGVSGGVYACIGMLCQTDSAKNTRMKFIFDIRENPFIFNLGDVKYLVAVETIIAALQYSKVIKNWPLGHIAHVTGFCIGIMCAYIYNYGFSDGGNSRGKT